jgi:phytoene dehydrogenase-like protein
MLGSSKYDAIVIGAGHNGLTAAAYLGDAGLSTLVLERREIVGGCCVTEEIAAGCRASTTSYIASMLRPEVTAPIPRAVASDSANLRTKAVYDIWPT